MAARPRTANAAQESTLRALAAAGWRLKPALGALPPLQLAQTVELEEVSYDEDQFDAGALRVYVNGPSGGGEIFAVLADTRVAAYRAFADLDSSNAFTVYRHGPYAVILPSRPVPHPLFAKLKTRQWSVDDLHRLVGTPSFDWNVHGVGHSGFTYVPQGLVFALDRLTNVTGIASRRRYQLDDGSSDTPPVKSLAALDYAKMSRDVRDQFANALLCDREQIDRELATGTTSPDGRMVASPINLIGLANTEEVFIRERGEPERRYPAPHFIEAECPWLDNRTILFKIRGAEDTLYGMDVRSGALTALATAPGFTMRDFGISSPQEIWYKTADGQAHTVAVPPH